MVVAAFGIAVGDLLRNTGKYGAKRGEDGSFHDDKSDDNHGDNFGVKKHKLRNQINAVYSLGPFTIALTKQLLN